MWDLIILNHIIHLNSKRMLHAHEALMVWSYIERFLMVDNVFMLLLSSRIIRFDCVFCAK